MNKKRQKLFGLTLLIGTLRRITRFLIVFGINISDITGH